MPGPLTYAAITPARNEAENLPRLAECLAAQTVRPQQWITVNDGSSDGTVDLARELAGRYPWVRIVEAPPAPAGTPLSRGRQSGRDVAAFTVGIEALEGVGDVVVKLDADVSFAPDFIERLLSAFAADDALGMAGGSCYERENGTWQQTHVTGSHVRGATRAYRRECLRDVLPLESWIGWDGIDEIKAGLAGWRTETILELPFYHHRRVGERDGARRRAWSTQGAAAYYMGYRPLYLFARALFQARREASALAMLSSYLGCVIRGGPRCQDPAVRDHLREVQQARALPLRLREALGKRA